MKILQSSIEKGLYILLIAMFVVNITVLFLKFKELNDLAKIAHTQTTQLQQIEDNQRVNSVAVKEYIACLITIKPTETPAQIQQDETNCFNNVPTVK